MIKSLWRTSYEFVFFPGTEADLGSDIIHDRSTKALTRTRLPAIRQAVYRVRVCFFVFFAQAKKNTQIQLFVNSKLPSQLQEIIVNAKAISTAAAIHSNDCFVIKFYY
jgi:hypothetical protein